MAIANHIDVVRGGYKEVELWMKNHPQAALDLSGADLTGCALHFSDLRNADLRGANLSRTDLSDVRFEGANLSGARFARSHCDGTNFRNANLADAIFSFADLARTNLEGLNLSGLLFNCANLTGAKLNNANLRKAILIGTNLSRASLVGTDVTGATLEATILADVRLDQVQGLVNLNHLGASNIGIETIVRSGGKIPSEFLRMCGAPDVAIQINDKLKNENRQHYNCFISYSRKDHFFVERLHKDLDTNFVMCWRDKSEMRGGEEFCTQIRNAINDYEKLIVVLSENSMESSWVKKEILMAREWERANGASKLFPIRLVDLDLIRKWEFCDPETGEHIGEHLTTLHIPDFSNSGHDSAKYQFEKQKFLESLRVLDSQ